MIHNYNYFQSARDSPRPSGAAGRRPASRGGPGGQRPPGTIIQNHNYIGTVRGGLIFLVGWVGKTFLFGWVGGGIFLTTILKINPKIDPKINPNINPNIISFNEF